MTNPFRRRALLGVGWLVGLGLLAGCWGPPTAPPPATAVSATSTLRTVTITWSNPPYDFWGARVFRAEGPTAPTGPEDGTLVGDVGDRTTITDVGLSGDRTYSYSVIMYGADGYDSTPATVTTTTTAISTVASGNGHSCALLANGTVECWGANANGQLGNGS
ncbi:MAG: RCC1 domain-containing protein, partial [Acidimicrobiales bacterium]|nr:RCC1 domain-containing protein [Acidimicrobiales bacterium]